MIIPGTGPPSGGLLTSRFLCSDPIHPTYPTPCAIAAFTARPRIDLQTAIHRSALAAVLMGRSVARAALTTMMRVPFPCARRSSPPP